MTRHNATNERIKRRYYTYLKDAKHRSDTSIDSAGGLHRMPSRHRVLGVARSPPEPGPQAGLLSQPPAPR